MQIIKYFICLFILLLNLTILPLMKKQTTSLENFCFKSVKEKDLPLLLNWFKEPHVSKWWPIPKPEENFFNDFLKRIRSKDIFPYLVLLNKKPIAYIQYYLINLEKNNWLPELPENTIGTDQFIGDPDYLGKGYGPLFIKSFIKFISEKNSKIKAIIVDPDPSNIIAIKCYKKSWIQNFR